MTFAFGAGLLATVNPCGFAMLPSFLALYLDTDHRRDETPVLSRCAHGFAVGLVLAGAFSGVLVFAGLVLAAGMRSLAEAVPWMAVAVGVGLACAGVAMLAGRTIAIAAVGRLGPAAPAGHGYTRVATFGVGYAIASLSCTLGVVLAVAGQATATANPIQVLGVFGAFAAGATSALLALTLSLALAKGLVARAMRRVAQAVESTAGVLLIVSGAYLVAYWLPGLLGHDGQPGGPVAEFTGDVSATLANFLAAHTGAFAIGLALAAAIGAGLAWASTRGVRAHRTEPGRPFGAEARDRSAHDAKEPAGHAAP